MSINVYAKEMNIYGEPKKLVLINAVPDHERPKEEIPIHHIQILDRSGSMCNSIDQLIEDCKKTIEMMKPEDFYTIIWFSSAGEFRTILKGIRNTEESKESSFRVLDSIKSVLGCTCFSESIQETEEIIAELESLCPNFSVTLFTDGEAVTPWSTSEEHNRVNKILERMSSKIIAFNTIGYGNYCNEEILESWSMYSEFGEFIHSSKINEYHEIFDENTSRARNLELSSIDLEIPGEVFYYCTTNSIIQVRDHVRFNHCDKDKNQFIVVIDPNKEISFKFNGVEYSSNSAHKIPDNWNEGILYKLAYAKYAYGDRYETIKILGKDLKDKNFVDLQTNSFSLDEVANFKKSLKKAAFRDSKLRNPNTCDDKYVPDENANCLLDLLMCLAQDENNCYCPSDDYQRIGRKTTDEFNMFHKREDEEEISPCPISDLIFNEKKLNISIRFKVNGYVSLNPKQAAKVNLDSEFPCSIYRTHTIVKDGQLNMNTMSVYVNKTTLEDIQDYFDDCIIGYVPYNGNENFYVDLDLTKIPIINAGYGNQNIEEVFSLVAQENLFKARIKVAKLIDNKVPYEATKYTEEQYKLLDEYGIKNGIYNGIKSVTPKVEDCDFYMSRTFELQFKGFSSLSPVHVDNGHIIIDGKIGKTGDTYLDYVIKTNDYHDKLSYYKYQLALVRARLSAIRIAKILTGRWFDSEKLSETNKNGIQTYEGICPYTGKPLTLNIKTAYEKSYF